MTISDFLVLVTIVLTLVTIAVSNNKKIWLYKFYKRDYCLLLGAVLCIHYLIGFPWFEQRGWIIPELVVKNGIPANILAYIIDFLTLSYLIFIIGWRKNFPCSKHEDIIRYYKGLINGNICLLMEYLDDYHKDKIQQRNRIVNGVAKDEDNKMPFESKSSKPKKKTQNLNGEVLQKVIFLPEFIEKSSSINPVFFLECVYQLKTDTLCGAEDSIFFYFRNLLKTKSMGFVRELVEPLNYKENSNIEYELRGTLFLSLMFAYIDFVTKFKIYRAFGEEALLEANIGNRIFSLEVDEFHNHEYHQTSCYMCLRFYDILFHRLFASCDENREEIPFIYPYYLKLVCDSLLDKYHQYSARSYAMKYMDDVVDYIYQWLDCIARKGIISYTYDLVKILVQIHKEKTKHIYTLESVQQLIKAFLRFSRDYGKENAMVAVFWRYIEDLNRQEPQLLYLALKEESVSRETLFYEDFQKLVSGK